MLYDLRGKIPFYQWYEDLTEGTNKIA